MDPAPPKKAPNVSQSRSSQEALRLGIVPWYSSVADPQRKPITTTIARLDSHPEERSRVANVSMVKSPKTANRKRWARTGNHQGGATGEGGSEEAKNKRVTAIQPRVADIESA